MDEQLERKMVRNCEAISIDIYREIGLGYEFNGDPRHDNERLEMLPGKDLYLCIHDFCASCFNQEKPFDSKVCRRTAINLARDEAEARWSKKLYSKLSKSFMHYVENTLLPEYNAKYRVVDNFMIAAKIIALTKILYRDDIEEIRENIRRNPDLVAKKPHVETLLSFTDIVNDMDKDDFVSSDFMFTQMLSSEMSEIHDDYIFYLRKRYMTECSDEKITRLLDVEYGI